MNKKGQIPGEAGLGMGGQVSPILIAGVIVFVIPFFGPLVKIKMPGWVGTIGFALIIIGVIHSILKASGLI